ncbi:MAG TPA: hypothetical protein VNT77_09705 [Allosphingosinicella sp.]|nr:hypothetical protein [Allosphingosinicella sp.]
MIFWGAALLLMTLSGASQSEAVPEPVQYAQISVRQQIIVRVPAQPAPHAPAAKPIEWKEEKGPECLPARAIAGATLLGRNSVDLVLRDHSRIRAKLEKSCPALDYYQGFYISPASDGMICADRDAIRSRVGGHCEIERFRSLRPVLKD